MIRKAGVSNQDNPKRNKKSNLFKGVPPISMENPQICNGKRVVKTSKNTNQMDVDQYFDGYGYHGTSFEQTYRCYPASFIDKPQLEHCDKIIMPPSALDRLASLHIDYPMLFELRNAAVDRVSHCGVLEFIAEEGMIYMPHWMMENLLLQEGDVIRVKNATLPKGKYVKLHPHTNSFLDISNPKAILETTLRNFSCLTTGDSIMVAYNNKKYYIDIVETKPSNAISIIETDCEVDFAPPLDYKEPERPVSSLPSKTPAEGQEAPAQEEPKCNPFTGSARRLDGKPLKEQPPPVASSSSKEKRPVTANATAGQSAGAAAAGGLSSQSSSRQTQGKLVFGSNANRNPDKQKAMGVHLQDEIIMDILSRLPVRSLLQLKCVSKLWKTLISDPYFKRKHLSRARNNQNSQKFLVSPLWQGKDLARYFSSLPLVRRDDDTQRVDYPYWKPWNHNIYSFCDGLFLIGTHDQHDRLGTIFLWNPSTRESTILANPELPSRKGCTWGLGYDSISDDYKILKISRELCSEIFALKSGSWRKIDNHPTGISPELSGMDYLAFVRGAFHWLGGVSPDLSLVSFSISNEVYGEIPLPKTMRSVSNAESTECGVSVLREMLCCYCTCIDQQSTFKLWLMKDYGVKESWTVMFTLRSPLFHSAIPRYGYTDTEVLLRHKYKGRVGSKFSTTKRCIFRFKGDDAFTDVVVYTESLISP